MSIKALIVDDEQNSRQTLRGLLQAIAPDVTILADAKNTEQARKYIETLQPDLVFLDINMPGETGIEFLESLGSPAFNVIFCTAYDEYAVKAFRLNAIDFLLKPIDPDELEQAIAKVKLQGTKVAKEQISQVGKQINEREKLNIDRIALPTSEGIHFVNLVDIVWLESLGSYTKFHINGQKPIVVSRLIKEYEELLEGHNFLRVHQSSVVNMKHVKKYVRGDGGQVWLSDGSEIEVARRRKDELIAALGNNFLQT